jgi:hypothetical protein
MEENTVFYKSLCAALLIPSLAFTATTDEQKAKAAARSLAFYKQKATECAAKSTSALILDVTKKAAIGAVMGAGAGAATVGLHMLDVYMHPAGSRFHPSKNILSRCMPYAWNAANGASPGPLNFSIANIDIGYPSAINFKGTRCGYSREVIRELGLENFDFDTQLVPVETALEVLKRMRSTYIKQNLCLLGIQGAAIGALLGTGYALYKQYYASTPEWIAQLDMLQDSDFAADPTMIGGKAYLVSQQFQDTSVTNPSYEFYFMPQTAELVTVYKQVITTLDGLSPDLKKLIACVSIRLVPNTSYSGSKVLPRIVVQLYPQTTQAEGNKLLKMLHNATTAFAGDGKYPRYSQPATIRKNNNLIYFAFGSGDMKDKNPDAFERKGSWMWRAADDMAYQNSSTQPLSLTAK